MRVAYITAGAAGMYCGSCMHDNTLVTALRPLGVDVALIPTYTPIRTDEEDVSMHRVFFGGINVFLQQKFSLFRHTPWLLDKLFDNRRLLKWVSRFSSSTDARELGALTVSVLAGEEGNQKKELMKLVAWLEESFKPDLVLIPNSMFVGFARSIKDRLGVPVLCALQGEDLFLDAMIEPYRERAFGLLKTRAADVDGFLANSTYYRELMGSYLAVDTEKIHLVPLGLNLDDHGKSEPDHHGDPFTIGYLARICPEKGLHLLVRAFKLLTDRIGREGVRLKIAGYLSPKDQAYADDLKSKIRGWGLESQVDFGGEVDRQEKIRFLAGLHVFSVPAPYKEPKGIYLLEALANGIPVVQPRHGAFTALVEDTGGGLLVEPHSPEALADGLSRLYQDRALCRAMGEAGKRSVHERHSSQTMAEKTLEVFKKFATA